nr:hypothetical protein [Actinomadura sp. NBRC 104412]
MVEVTGGDDHAVVGEAVGAVPELLPHCVDPGVLLADNKFVEREKLQRVDRDTVAVRGDEIAKPIMPLSWRTQFCPRTTALTPGFVNLISSRPSMGRREAMAMPSSAASSRCDLDSGNPMNWESPAFLSSFNSCSSGTPS